jgi:mitochondrial fission protein ELM1
MTTPRITEFSVSTVATEPLRGIVEIGTGGSTMKFEFNEDVAHAFCAELEHFLTQRPNKVQRQQ